MLIALLLAAAMPACSWDRAHYELVGDSRYTVDVAPLIYDNDASLQHIRIKLTVRSAVSGSTLWFFPDGGSATRLSLISMNDPSLPGWTAPDPDSRRGRPHRDLSMDAYAADLGEAAHRYPAPGEPAASYMAIPGLSDELRFLHVEDPRDNRERMPDALFRLTSCR